MNCQATLTTSPSTDTPRIYVACLASYSAGMLHGAWLDIAGDTENLSADIQAMLEDSPIEGAEEYAIHSYEGFGEYRVHEHESLDALIAIATLIEEHGLIITAWLSVTGEDPTEDATSENFEDSYLGTWDSLVDYAYDYLEDTGMLDSVPESMRRYIDVAAFARDLELGGDIWTTHHDGHLHIFRGG